MLEDKHTRWRNLSGEKEYVCFILDFFCLVGCNFFSSCNTLKCIKTHIYVRSASINNLGATINIEIRINLTLFYRARPNFVAWSIPRNRRPVSFQHDGKDDEKTLLVQSKKALYKNLNCEPKGINFLKSIDSKRHYWIISELTWIIQIIDHIESTVEEENALMLSACVLIIELVFKNRRSCIVMKTILSWIIQINKSQAECLLNTHDRVCCWTQRNRIGRVVVVVKYVYE